MHFIVIAILSGLITALAVYWSSELGLWCIAGLAVEGLVLAILASFDHLGIDMIDSAIIAFVGVGIDTAYLLFRWRIKKI